MSDEKMEAPGSRPKGGSGYSAGTGAGGGVGQLRGVGAGVVAGD
jgi:hypothetical protein